MLWYLQKSVIDINLTTLYMTMGIGLVMKFHRMMMFDKCEKKTQTR